MSAATTKEPNGALQLLVATASAYGVYRIYAYYVSKQSHRAGKIHYFDADHETYRVVKRKHSKERQNQGTSSPTTRTRGINKKSSSRSRDKQSGSFSSDIHPNPAATTTAADEDVTTTNQEIDDNGDPINENKVDLIGQFYWDKLSEKARLLLEQQMLIQESFIPGFIQDAKDRLRVQDYQNAKKAVLEKKKLEKMLKKLEFRYHLVLTCLTDLDIAYCKRKLALDVSKSTLLRLELDELVESKIADCKRKYFDGGGNSKLGSLMGGIAGSSGFSSPTSSKASTRNNYQLAATASSLYPSLDEPRKHIGNHVFQQQSPQFPLRSSPEGENFHSGRLQQQQQQQQQYQQRNGNSTRNNMSLLAADDIPNEFDDLFESEDGSFLLEQPRSKPPTPVNIAYYPEGTGGHCTSTRGTPVRSSFFRRTRQTRPASLAPGIYDISAAGRSTSPGAGTMLTSSVHHAGTSDTKSTVLRSPLFYSNLSSTLTFPNPTPLL
ncbi:unnamed protein product [Amoebophrya sp. A120]|nr:unnamed protein product [Amoebophrya sp. A120]|eukprot:GSA120T00004461001.1